MNDKLSNKRKLWGWLILVTVVSWGGAWLLPVTPLMKELASVPGAFALIGALFQILRDQAAHERQILRDEAEHTRQVVRDDAAHERQLQRDETAHRREHEIRRAQESFSLGATSHMANVVFDKHAAFCEDYLEEMHQTLETLFREGPTEAALVHCRKLFAVRRKYAAWVTSDLAAALDPYERALRGIGADAHFVEATRGTGDELRSKKIEEMYALFTAVVGEWATKGGERDPEKDTDLVMNKLRKILGIEELTTMRVRLVRRALLASE